MCFLRKVSSILCLGKSTYHIFSLAFRAIIFRFGIQSHYFSIWHLEPLLSLSAFRAICFPSVGVQSNSSQFWHLEQSHYFLFDFKAIFFLFGNQGRSFLVFKDGRFTLLALIISPYSLFPSIHRMSFTLFALSEVPISPCVVDP